MKIISISDTHNKHREIKHIPDGDVLVHAGDITNVGEVGVLGDFADWMSQFPHKKVIIAGNHDLAFTRSSREYILKYFEEKGIIYLEDSGVEIDGVRFWGSPFQPEFHNWAFNLPRGKALIEKWAMIPDDTSVLITHGPPYQILDKAPRGVFDYEHVGCKDLLERILELSKLKAHIFGHIHDCSGIYEEFGVKFVNSAICNERHQPINLAKEFEI
jgi:Icc-related predicted phosphoesterase